MCLCAAVNLGRKAISAANDKAKVFDSAVHLLLHKIGKSFGSVGNPTLVEQYHIVARVELFKNLLTFVRFKLFGADAACIFQSRYHHLLIWQVVEQPLAVALAAGNHKILKSLSYLNKTYFHLIVTNGCFRKFLSLQQYQKIMKSFIAHSTKIISAATLLLMLMIALCPARAVGQEAETMQKITAALTSGNATALANHFNTTVALTLPVNDGTYSKKQAEQLVKMFFEKNPVSDFTTEHHGTSNDGSGYIIGELHTTQQKTFRVYVLTKKRDGIDLIQQLQIEEE